MKCLVCDKKQKCVRTLPYIEGGRQIVRREYVCPDCGERRETLEISCLDTQDFFKTLNDVSVYWQRRYRLLVEALKNSVN